jgi:hypothetical protein
MIKYLNQIIKNRFEESKKQKILVAELFLERDFNVPSEIYHNLPLVNPTDIERDELKRISNIVDDTSCFDLFYSYIYTIAYNKDYFLLDSMVKDEIYIRTYSPIRASYADLYPFGYLFMSYLGEDKQLIPGLESKELEELIVEDGLYNIISCSNPIENKHWARMTGKQRIYIAKLHEMRKRKVIEIDSKKIIPKRW